MKTSVPLPIIGFILIAVAIIGIIILFSLKKSKKIEKKIANIITVVLIIVAIVGGVFAIGSKSDNKPSSDRDGTGYGAGGYEMPNENDDSFADYVQRVDPDLYNDMADRYNDAVGK